MNTRQRVVLVLWLAAVAWLGLLSVPVQSCIRYSDSSRNEVCAMVKSSVLSPPRASDLRPFLKDWQYENAVEERYAPKNRFLYKRASFTLAVVTLLAGGLLLLFKHKKPPSSNT